MVLKISDIDETSVVNGEVYAIDRLEIKPMKNGQFFKLRLSDSTGKIDAVMWKGIEPFIGKINSGSIVKVSGTMGMYQNNLQLTITALEEVKDLSQEGLEKFLPEPPFPIEDMYNELISLVDTVGDPHLQKLIQLFRMDEETLDLFKKVPGGKKWHHAYMGGLLHHTLSMMKIADAIVPLHPMLNRDELITGVLFHDIGKTRELSISGSFDYSTEGRLIGHIHIGDSMVSRYISRIPEFPEETAFRLRHLILSHHGEQGEAPVMPMTLEACILYPIDLMDSQYNAYARELSKAEKAEQPWTDYVNLIGRYLFRGNRSIADTPFE